MVRQAEQLSVTLKTPGWVDVVQPLLDKMITDCIGAKKGEEWHGGYLHKNDADVEHIRAYTQALIEFQNMLHDHFRLADKFKDMAKQEAKEKKLYSSPMNDTRYRP